MRARTAQLASSKEELQHQGQVISPYDGVVTSQRMREGQIVQSGAPIYDVDVTEAHDMVGIVFVPALTGNKLKPGSVIQISPGAIDS